MIQQLPQRFSSKIDFSGECWIWIASKRNGYGSYRDNRKTLLTHRFVWEFYNGCIPKGLHVLHKCDNPSCVNVNHLFIGTHVDNMADKKVKGRNIGSSGEANGRSKLTKIQVDEIRENYIPGSGSSGNPSEFSMKGLAKKYGVSSTQISYIVKNKSWKVS